MTEQAQAGAGGQQQQSAQQGTQQGNGDGQQQQQQPFWHTLPDNMRGDTAEATLQKLMPSWQGYHKQWTEREPALGKPEDLAFEITSDKAKPFFDPKAPAAGIFAKAAVEAGLTKKQASMIADKFMGQAAEQGLFADTLDVKSIVTAQAALLGHKELTPEAKAAVETAHTEMTAWATNTGKQMGLSEAGQIELESLVLTPGGMEIVQALQKQGGGTGFALGGAGGGAAMTKDAVFAMLNDDRYNSQSPKFDKQFRKQADEAYARLRNAHPQS